MHTEKISTRRRKFLVVVDSTPEHRVALRFAARRALHTDGHVALMTVISPPDQQQWSSVHAIMLEEAYEAAEKILYDAATELYSVCGKFAELVIREGKTRDAVLAQIHEDRDISILVLGAGTGKEGPGMLVSAAAANAKAAFPIPVTIVPGGLSDSEIDFLA
ncbi:MAG TPA: universal stress protein UspA [Alphaproteobacteria bacterium]|nr:universal stress protein UspA [Alphaproteobacteria bacterium]HAJ48600.1 universal stress protein UspA [Alphaproteobacteria bacterium]